MSKIFQILCVVAIISVEWISYVLGHGMMLEPPGRASRWRSNSSAPANYNDMELFCGGLVTTWQVHGGKCGICGDNYALPTPRPHELGGEYGEGHIVATYAPGTDIPISVKVVANHKGYFVFDICNLDSEKETENCFHQIKTTDGETEYYLKSFDPGMFYLSIHLPSRLNCKHCVLRWQYTAANMWGQCGDGSYAVGCGPQEIYRSCADIAVLRNNRH